MVDGDHLLLRVTPDSPQSSLLGGVRHALDPSLSVSEHEARMVQEIRLDWSQLRTGWLLQNGSNGELLGIDDRSRFDSENLAQCCVNWLCT